MNHRLLFQRAALLVPVSILSIFQQSFAQPHADYVAAEIEFSRQTFPINTDTIMNVFPVDLDGDGDSDVVVTGGTLPSDGGGSRGPQEGLVLFNNGDNTFTVADGDRPGSESARAILVEDFNKDGILDFYIADHGYDAPPFPGFKNQLLLGTGTGFIDITDSLPDIEAFTHSAASGDIDGDGDIDIFAINSDSIEFELSYFLINDGAANFTLDRSRLPLSLSSLAQLRNSYSAELTDLDSDGLPELIIGRRDFTNLTPTRIHWNNGEGLYSDADVTYLDEIDVFNNLEKTHVIDIKGMDFDGDGRTDLLLNAYGLNAAGTSIQLFMNSGNRVFRNESNQRLGSIALNSDPNYQVPYWFNVADINGDGLQDLLPVFNKGTELDSLFLYEGAGNGCFNPVTLADVLPGATADFDTLFTLGEFPLRSAQEFGYGTFGAMLINGEKRLFINYVPVNISPRPAIANYYHNCSGKLKFSLAIEGMGMYTSDFSLVATAPDIVVQVDAASVVDLTETRENIASFDTATGRLLVPELVVDGQVLLRNLVFVMSNTALLQLTLESYE